MTTSSISYQDRSLGQHLKKYRRCSHSPRILVDDYGYPKDVIQTRPQWRVKARPSDTKKEYPVDIAVFSDASHSDETLSIVVECKKKTRKDGMTQLQDYMRLSKASMGVWFNGNERLFLAKREHDGKVEFYEIPNIPRYGERLEDIGKFKRKDLRPAESLKSTFKAIRNYLAANAVGITRDEVLASQMINLIFCKIYDERFTKPDDTVRFRAGVDESASNGRKANQGSLHCRAKAIQRRYNEERFD